MRLIMQRQVRFIDDSYNQLCQELSTKTAASAPVTAAITIIQRYASQLNAQDGEGRIAEACRKLPLEYRPIFIDALDVSLQEMKKTLLNYYMRGLFSKHFAIEFKHQRFRKVEQSNNQKKKIHEPSQYYQQHRHDFYASTTSYSDIGQDVFLKFDAVALGKLYPEQNDFFGGDHFDCVLPVNPV